jgi:ankyrin repeat protein
VAYLEWRVFMKKLLLFTLLSVAIPAVAVGPRVNVRNPNGREGLFINPTVVKFKGTDIPNTIPVLFLVNDDKQEIIDYGTLPVFLSQNINDIDQNGRNLIWWVALMGKKNLFNNMVKNGANPDLKSTGGVLSGFSARQLIQMSPQEIEDVIEAGPNAAKQKL